MSSAERHHAAHLHDQPRLVAERLDERLTRLIVLEIAKIKIRRDGAVNDEHGLRVREVALRCLQRHHRRAAEHLVAALARQWRRRVDLRGVEQADEREVLRRRLRADRRRRCDLTTLQLVLHERVDRLRPWRRELDEVRYRLRHF